MEAEIQTPPTRPLGAAAVLSVRGNVKRRRSRRCEDFAPAASRGVCSPAESAPYQTKFAPAPKNCRSCDSPRCHPDFQCVYSAVSTTVSMRCVSTAWYSCIRNDRRRTPSCKRTSLLPLAGRRRRAPPAIGSVTEARPRVRSACDVARAAVVRRVPKRDPHNHRRSSIASRMAGRSTRVRSGRTVPRASRISSGDAFSWARPATSPRRRKRVQLIGKLQAERPHARARRVFVAAPDNESGFARDCGLYRFVDDRVATLLHARPARVMSRERRPTWLTPSKPRRSCSR